MNDFYSEVKTGKRFEFGANWSHFLNVLNDERISLADASLKSMLGVDDLKGKRFIDIGSGSGLFSLAARRLGASVHSFDYDPQSVACTAELKQRFFPNDNDWVVEEGSVLDTAYLRRLGQFDVVYSWGVLHHTGAMWQALEHVIPLVAGQGRLFIAIYNDQGRESITWNRIKKVYCAAPNLIKKLIVALCMLRLWGPTSVRDIIAGDPGRTWRTYATLSGRGMSPWRDVVDWVGGYPFEVSKPEEVFDFFHGSGFQLNKLTTCGGGLGCNEFIFIKP